MNLALEPCDYVDGFYDDTDRDDQWILDHVEDHMIGLIEKLSQNASNDVLVPHIEEIVFALGLPAEVLSPLLETSEKKDDADN